MRSLEMLSVGIGVEGLVAVGTRVDSGTPVAPGPVGLGAPLIPLPRLRPGMLRMGKSMPRMLRGSRSSMGAGSGAATANVATRRKLENFIMDCT